MSQGDKARFYGALKAAGTTFDRHYREYSTDELQAAYEKLIEGDPDAALEEDLEEGYDEDEPTTPPPAPVSRDLAELPGQRLNVKDEDEPIRVDEDGLIWFQEEVRKPAYPQPRGRRVLKYLERGTKTETVQNGDYIETFEVSGDLQSRQAEIKITLPSYQVGIYQDPRLPFRTHVYNELRGFDFFEVNDYYSGPDMVPEEIKRMYVENVLCYDIRTVVRAIQSEYRQLQLAGKVE